MKKNVVLDVSNYFSEQLGYDKDSYEKFKYGLSILYLNFTKTLVLILITLVLGIFKETMIFMGSYSVVRAFGFGTHVESSVKCTIIGLTLFIGGTYVGIYIRFSMVAYILLLSLSLIITLLYAPLATKKRPISPKKNITFKIYTIIAIMLLSALILHFGDGMISNLILMGILVEMFQIIPYVDKFLNKW